MLRKATVAGNTWRAPASASPGHFRVVSSLTERLPATPDRPLGALFVGGLRAESWVHLASDAPFLKLCRRSAGMLPCSRRLHAAGRWLQPPRRTCSLQSLAFAMPRPAAVLPATVLPVAVPLRRKCPHHKQLDNAHSPIWYDMRKAGYACASL